MTTQVSAPHSGAMDGPGASPDSGSAQQGASDQNKGTTFPGDKGKEKPLSQSMQDQQEEGQQQEQQQDFTKKEIPAMPDGGKEKYYNTQTGEYDYESERKELLFRVERRAEKEEAKDDKASGEAGEKAKDSKADSPSITDETWDLLGRELEATGDIGEESRELLRNGGISDRVIDEYKEGRAAMARLLEIEHAEYAGGKERLDAILKHAGETMSDTEIQAANQKLSSLGDWKTQMDSLIYQFEKSNGRTGEPRKDIEGKPAKDAGLAPIVTYKELNAIIETPEYQNDQEYQNQVLQRAIKGGLNL